MAAFHGVGRRWTPQVLSVLRIVTAFLFVQHGTAKLFHFPHVAMPDGLQVMSLIGLAGIIEVVGGLYFCVAGPGTWSLDGLRGAGRSGH